MASLDSIDRRLLAELQAEGRVTNVELAQRVGLTAPPCLRRVRALEEAGVIKGYHAELDASKLGFAITVFAMVSLKSQAEDDLRAFETLVQSLPEGMQQAPPVVRQRSAPCKFTYSGLMVRSDGRVQVCACESSVNAPELIVGDIATQTLGEIWTGEQVRALRDSFGSGSLNPNCSRCDFYYKPAEFRSLDMRRHAKSSRRRHRGELVRHTRPMTGTWQME